MRRGRLVEFHSLPSVLLFCARVQVEDISEVSVVLTTIAEAQGGATWRSAVMEAFDDGRELAVMGQACAKCHRQVRALIRTLLADCFRSCRPGSALDEAKRITITARREEGDDDHLSPAVRLTFADTGRGISDGLMAAHCRRILGETMDCSTPCTVHHTPEVVWNGEILVMTTTIEDAEIRRYAVRVVVDRKMKETIEQDRVGRSQPHSKLQKLRFQSQPEIVQLASLVKPRGAFSGSERSVMLNGRSFEDCVVYLESLCYKLSILNMKVLVELHLHHLPNLPGHETRQRPESSTALGASSHMLVTFAEGIAAPATCTNLERLKTGIEGYLSRRLGSPSDTGADEFNQVECVDQVDDLRRSETSYPSSSKGGGSCSDVLTIASSCSVGNSHGSSRRNASSIGEGDMKVKRDGVLASRWRMGIGGAGFEAGSRRTPWTVHACVIAYLKEVVDINGKQEAEHLSVPDGGSRRSASLFAPSEKGRICAEIIFFSNFAYQILPQSVSKVLQSRVAWEGYGLKVEKNDDGRASLSISSGSSGGGGGDGMELRCELQMRSVATDAISKIELILHQYAPFGVPVSEGEKPSTRTESRLVKQAVEMALDELKTNEPTIFDSMYQAKVRRCIPDLSKCVSSIVLQSTDESFRQECAHLVGFRERDELDRLADFICRRLETVVVSLEEKKRVTRPAPSSSSSSPPPPSIAADSSATSSYSNEGGSFSSRFRSSGPDPMQVPKAEAGMGSGWDGEVGTGAVRAKRRLSSPPPPPPPPSCSRIASDRRGRRITSWSGTPGDDCVCSDRRSGLWDDIGNGQEVSSHVITDARDLDFWS
ncbi:hypothetical protein CBR_g8804 [Chara braunii]|uniref:Uncharacterized protein n=1 Tax=Chara braunii TaxID=69332 RepID=A0A388KMX9_CHABU|nr:hypothetical protein CBR_g8804 [Chara braunii]|eukprot:GBG71385.1 hypothetical protein CBR_g8804 [Chara braunii]